MIAESLLQLPIFASLISEDIQMLLDSASNRTVYYNEREYIAMQGDRCKSLYILYSGTVNAQMVNPDGKLLTIETLHAPQLLAPAFIYATDNRFPVNIVAITQCEMLIISRDSFLRFIHLHPTVMASFIQDISDRSAFLSRKLNEFALQSLRERIINYLEKYGIIKNQQAAALKLGVARPSLAKVITDLIDDDILTKDKDGIKLK